MNNGEDQWPDIVSLLGFEDIKHLLTFFYVEQHYGLFPLAKLLGFAPATVRRRLLQCGIQLRSRGGDNRTGKTFLTQLSNDDLFNSSPKELAKLYNVHISTIFAEKRRRGKTWKEMAIFDLPPSRLGGGLKNTDIDSPIV